jgi:hypothetical protein
MDFVGPFPEINGYNYLWVVICHMINMVHLILVNTKMTASQLSWIHLKKVVRLHGLPVSIVSDQDSKFTSKWWRELHQLMGMKLLMSTSFHLQMDGVTERANRSIGQLFQAAISLDQKDWVYKIPMMEFAINASISKSMGFTPFELGGAYMPTMIFQLPESNTAPPGIRSFAQQALQNLAAMHNTIIASHVFQWHYANLCRCQEPTIKQGDLVYLATKNLLLPKGRASKIMPKYVGPYKVLQAYPETSNYMLGLPSELVRRRVHPSFMLAY